MTAKLQSLKGHKGEVLCLESPVHSVDPLHCILSGSCDGTARLWDVRESNAFASCACFKVPDQTAVRFLMRLVVVFNVMYR